MYMENNNNVRMCAYPIGYTFVPEQHFGRVYDMDMALERGTLFPELDLPMGVYGKEGYCNEC